MTEEATIRVRMSARDAHYAGGLVAGATMLALFGDIATEIAIRLHGDEGLFRAYESIEFLAPVYAGDFIEASGKVVHMGNTSMKIEFVANKVIAASGTVEQDSAADVLEKPIVVCRATGTTVVLKDRQRKPRT